MKSKIALMACLMGFSYSFAQETMNMDVSLKNYSKMIDSIVVSEKVKMNKELDEVDHDFKRNKINSDEKQKQRADIASKYEQTINEKIDAHRNEFEEFTRQAVKDAVLKPVDSLHKDKNQIVFGLGGVSILMDEDKTKPADYLRTWQYVVALVGTNYTTKDKTFAFLNNTLDFKNTVFNSAVYMVRYQGQLGNFTSPFFYRLGLGYRWDQSKAKYGKTFTQENQILDTKEFTKGNLKDTHINNHYLFVPVEFKFVLNPKYIEHNGTKYLNNRVSQFSIVAGVYGAVRIASNIYNKYSNDYSKRIVERESINHGVNDIIFGGKLGIGYAGFNVFVQKDFTPAFNNNANLKSKYGLQIGIELLNASF
ncbi:hypothetical protein SAMN05421846_11178 [Chryseobacterium taeanense]|uniref:Outer membrane protein beta-barrel domain-containing protein n=1 Tax=Chryseobacterium taeanense TaxID=311334 RepID=A0A1G8MCD2_9FLAO|nr:hypothetical protein [Chryseobacterium taeanense]SDI65608.1 hypothetical protein SAMN05421846_11178 [Chryseobacterium taeanense]